jgi:hypothetical protein
MTTKITKEDGYKTISNLETNKYFLNYILDRCKDNKDKGRCFEDEIKDKIRRLIDKIEDTKDDINNGCYGED